MVALEARTRGSMAAGILKNLYLRLFEVEEGNYEPLPGRSDKFTLIEINLLPGRDEVLKKSTIQEITRMLGELLAIAPEDIFIVISDPLRENWGHRGIQATEW